MIISHKYKFIFLHVPKTAGSSVNTFFSQYIGDNDILNGWNHSLREGIPYNRNILSMVNTKFGLKMISKAINLRIKDHKLFERPIIEFAYRELLKKKIGTTSMHATANQLKKFDKTAWNKYFKFAFVRNPYTHAISDWMFNEKQWSIINDNKLPTKRKFTKKGFVKHLKSIKKDINNKKSYYYNMRPFSKIYTINDKIAVDFIGKFENLKDDVYKIQKILKLPKKNFQLIHSKKNTLNKHLKYYNEESRELVKEIWNKEFEFFKYEFPKK
jgi:hypothetical protein